ncbi:hypothetical protein, partial [Helicobacter cinaedi]|uniref:hypothetical protein n=1 Tax=Helicobacter cinaedi TaxID=213 RepID=UPI001A9C694F
RFCETLKQYFQLYNKLLHIIMFFGKIKLKPITKKKKTPFFTHKTTFSCRNDYSTLKQLFLLNKWNL